MPRIDLLPTLETCYRLDLNDEEWANELCRAAMPWLNEGLGVAAWFFDLRTGPHPGIRSPVSLGSHNFMSEVASIRATPIDAARHGYLRGGPVSTARRAFAHSKPTFEELVHELGPANLQDFVALVGASPNSLGIVLGAQCPRVRDLRAQEIAWMARVSAHLGNAFRLRTALQQQYPNVLEAAQVEGIFDPSGRVAHAVTGDGGGLLAQLRHSILQRDRARSKRCRLDSVERLALWRGLVAGRWSLVDHFDTDQRRFVVALRNPPEGTVLRSLSNRESQVVGYVALGWSNKAIAYAMGLSESTVGSHLSCGARKLGARNRSTVIEIARVLGGAHISDCDAQKDAPDGPKAAFGAPELKLVELTSRVSVAPAPLTRAEKEVLAAVLRGASNAEIAIKRGRSLGTIAKQVASLFRKLRVCSRSELSAAEAVHTSAAVRSLLRDGRNAH